MKVMIGVPAVRGNVTSETLSAIVGICAVLASRNQGFGVTIVGHADLSIARNLLAKEFLGSDCGLFVGIDDDVGIDAGLFAQLLDLSLPLIGAYLPQRLIELPRFEEAIRQGLSGQRAQIEAAPYVGPPVEDRDALLKPRVFEAPYVATGFYIVQRTVLERIAELGLALDAETNQANYKGTTTGFFNNIVSGGDYLSEDLSFCERVRQAGFKVMAYAGPGISHTGTMTFRS